MVSVCARLLCILKHKLYGFSFKIILCICQIYKYNIKVQAMKYCFVNSHSISDIIYQRFIFYTKSYDSNCIINSLMSIKVNYTVEVPLNATLEFSIYCYKIHVGGTF